MNLPQLDITSIEKYLKITKARGAHTISIIAKLNKHFEGVFGSDIGKELIVTHVNRLEDLLTLIYNEKASDKEWAEFRVLKKMLDDEVKRIKVYLDKVNEVRKIASTI